MDAEVIAIGDELTSGQRLDTNSQWLSCRLGELGIKVLYHSTAADELDACRNVFRTAIGRADVVIATGGLGPTADDLTREVLAAATGQELQLDRTVLETIENRFRSRGRTMPERNKAQAMFPQGSQAIANPHGTAPGIVMRIARTGKSDCLFIALPGVPAELYEMWDATVEKAISALEGRAGVICHRQIRCFGVGESHLEEMLPDLIRRGRNPTVGITVSQATITLRIIARGADEAECRRLMEPAVEVIQEKLGSLVFGEGEEELQHAVAGIVGDKDVRLATVEWGTAGLVAQALGEMESLHSKLSGSLIVQSSQALSAALALKPTFCAQHPSTSREIAEAMAESARKRFGADYTLAVSDVPNRPALKATGQGDQKQDSPQLPRFHVALASAEGVVSQGFTYTGHPEILKVLSAKRALNYLRLFLREKLVP